MNTQVFIDLNEATLKALNIPYCGDLSVTRGLYYHGTQDIYINLNCVQVKQALSVNEEYFISVLTQTIIHEYIHAIIDTKTIPTTYSVEGEDSVCEILAHTDETSTHTPKRNI